MAKKTLSLISGSLRSFKGRIRVLFFCRCLSEIRMFNHTLPCYWCSASVETTFVVGCSKVSETTTMDLTENKIYGFNLMV